MKLLKMKFLEQVNPVLENNVFTLTNLNLSTPKAPACRMCMC